MKPLPLVLIVDDEPQIRKMLRVTLEAAGYRSREADSGKTGLADAAMHRPDAVVLDLGLPDLDGVAVLRRLREWCRCPVLILSVREATEQKVAALEAGADDYLTKPFDGAELVARLRALARRTATPDGQPVVEHGPLRIDLVARRVTLEGKEIHLTATEYALLALLARHAGRVLTHQQILREIWGPKATEQRQYLRVHLASLRAKLGPGRYVRTEPGVGYRFEAAARDA